MKNNLEVSPNNLNLEKIRKFDFSKNVKTAISSDKNMNIILHEINNKYRSVDEQVAFVVTYGKYIEKISKEGGNILMLKKLKLSIEKMFKVKIDINI